MDFSKITAAVIGLGLMGGSFAMRLKELGAAVIGINRTLSTAEAALRQGIVDSIDISDLKHADICYILHTCQSDTRLCERSPAGLPLRHDHDRYRRRKRKPCR